jgi:HEAT repeat protein
MKSLWVLLSFSFLSTLTLTQALAAIPKLNMAEVDKIRLLEASFKSTETSPISLKKMVFSLKNKAVPVLIKVMKDKSFPDKSRWQATMLLGQVMGKKSQAFIAKFTQHPDWVMRVAALKALTALDVKVSRLYQQALKDPSLIVRVQALESIALLTLKDCGAAVWGMMFDQSNYSGENGKRKRTSIIKGVIKTVGDLGYKPAYPVLVKLSQNKRYKDLHPTLIASLSSLKN